jgi:hypothetical protein
LWARLCSSPVIRPTNQANHFLLLFLLFEIKMGSSGSSEVMNSAGTVATSIFEFNVPGIDGTEISLSQFKGKKVYLVVNVASA